MQEMPVKKSGKRIFWIGAVWILGVLGVLFAREYYLDKIFDPSAGFLVLDTDAQLSFSQWVWAGLILLAAFNFLAWRTPHGFFKKRKLYLSAQMRMAIGSLVLFLPAVIIYWIPFPAGRVFGYWSACFFVFGMALLGVLISADRSDGWRDLISRLGLYLLISGAVFAIASRMALVNDYPFPQYWSEGNRFYDYSTLFGGFRYRTADAQRIQAFITPGMAFPWALPFALPSVSIRAFRLYYQCVWILPALLFGCLAVRTRDHSRLDCFAIIAFTGWTYLFLEQGPVYPPLILAGLLVLLALRSRSGLAILLVFVASYYAHISRWTWSYAPGIWAGTLSVLAIERETIAGDWKKALIRPILLGLSGLAGGLLLPALSASPMAASLVNPLPFTERQPLLWNRLLPNATYPPGILLGLAWGAGAALLLLILLVVRNRRRLHRLQISVIGLSLAAFLVVGIIASAKIGGGSNLHNLDMFLISIVLLLAFFMRNEFLKPEINQTQWVVLGLAMLLTVVSPVAYTMRGSRPDALPMPEISDEALLQVRAWVNKMKDSGDVLFMDHRQLLTFGYITDVTLVQEYEKKLLMDMAMGEQSEYFSGFYDDLAAQRFALIINEPTGLFIKDIDEAFSEENNAYVEWVTFPLLCNYYPVVTIKEVGLELLLPRTVLPLNVPHCLSYLER